MKKVQTFKSAFQKVTTATKTFFTKLKEFLEPTGETYPMSEFTEEALRIRRSYEQARHNYYSFR
jgi:hypothetical protein